MREKIVSILTELRPEFDFNEPLDFIEEGMLDSFDVINLVTALDSELSTVRMFCPIIFHRWKI